MKTLGLVRAVLRSSATPLADCHPRGNNLHYVQRKYWDISPECNGRQAESHKLELLLPASRLFLWKRKSEKKKETRETGKLGTSQQRSSPPTEKHKLLTECALTSSKLFSCFTLWSYVFKMILCPNWLIFFCTICLTYTFFSALYQDLWEKWDLGESIVISHWAVINQCQKKSYNIIIITYWYYIILNNCNDRGCYFILSLKHGFCLGETERWGTSCEKSSFFLTGEADFPSWTSQWGSVIWTHFLVSWHNSCFFDGKKKKKKRNKCETRFSFLF